jgi:DNA-binding NarL/FixJ family response regulator
MSLVLCDDHDMFLEALVTALTRLGQEIDAVSQQPDQVVDLVVQHQPEVCVLDVMFAGFSGLDAAARIRDRAPEVKVLLLTGAATDEVWRAYDGRVVDGVVNKVCDIDVLQSSINRVADGERVVEGWSRQPALESAPDWPAETLSEREQQVLDLLVQGATTEMIAVDLGVSTNTVRTHVQNLLRKLGVHGRAKAVSMAVSGQIADTRVAAR